MKKIIWTLAVVLWMCMIFWFSAKPAEESTEMSISVGRMAGGLFIKDFNSWTPERQEQFAEKIDHAVRKSAHATEYALLGFLAAGMYSVYGKKGRRLYIMAAGTGFLYAASDEFHQLFVPGRSGQISDVLLDSCGAAVGAALFLCILFIWQNYIRKQEETFTGFSQKSS